MEESGRVVNKMISG